MSGLITSHGARPVTLRAFDSDTALRALTRVLGEERVRAEPDAVAELRDRCSGLPLALGIVAARAHIRPALADVAAELREEASPLEALDAGEQTASLRTVFSWSYRALSPPAGRLFRLLGLHPGPDVTARASAGLAGLPLPQAKRLLAELAGAHLISEHVPGRFTLHDLLRAYATEQAHTNDGPDERATAVHRMLDHYLRTAYAAALRIYPHRDPIGLPDPQPGSSPEEIGDARRAMAWFAAEHPVLLSAIRSVDAPAYVWRLAWTMVTFLDRQGWWEDLRAAHEVVLDTTADDPLGYAHGNVGFGIAQARLGHHDDAILRLRWALDRFVRLDDRVDQARVHQNLCWVLGGLGRKEEAIGHHRQCLALYEAENHRCGVAIALNGMGWLNAANGDCYEAIANCEQALILYEELDHVYGQAGTWDTLGYAHYKLGDYARAITCYERVLTLLEENLDARYERTQTLSRLGDAHHANGDTETARRHWREAAKILEEIHHPAAGRLRAKLS